MNLKNACFVPLLSGSLMFVLIGQLTAQTQTLITLHNFNGNDGATPIGRLILAGSTLYGTTSGGSSGSVFAVGTNGTSFRILHTFSGSSDGAVPYAGLLLAGATLYGTATYGGPSGGGTVYAVGTNGTGFTIVHNFGALTNLTNSGGFGPVAGLIFSGGKLYGTTVYGGLFGNGVVFAVNTNGTGFTNLYSFTSTAGSPGTNIDGANPYAGLLLSGSILYGTTQNGGRSGNGTVFALNINTKAFTNLHSFSAFSSTLNTNSDGANPQANLILSGSTLYGTAVHGGTGGNGTIFSVHTNGTGFVTLHPFGAKPNSDGTEPIAALTLFGTTLYGAASAGGKWDNGTLFALNTDGTGFYTLYSFTGTYPTNSPVSTNWDGASPTSRLILSGDVIYGAASVGGTSGDGTVFGIFNAPFLALKHLGKNVVLSWSTNAVGFSLQSSTNLELATAWSGVSQKPVVSNGQNTVTNTISATRRFYRLIR